jgi:hypothetical protein
MAKRTTVLLGLAALCCAAPVTAQAGWDLRLYQPPLYSAPPYPFPYYAQYPSAYYYPPFYNARIGYVPERYLRHVEHRRKPARRHIIVTR